MNFNETFHIQLVEAVMVGFPINTTLQEQTVLLDHKGPGLFHFRIVKRVEQKETHYNPHDDTLNYQQEKKGREEEFRRLAFPSDI